MGLVIYSCEGYIQKTNRQSFIYEGGRGKKKKGTGPSTCIGEDSTRKTKRKPKREAGNPKGHPGQTQCIRRKGVIRGTGEENKQQKEIGEGRG